MDTIKAETTRILDRSRTKYLVITSDIILSETDKAYKLKVNRANDVKKTLGFFCAKK